MSNYRTVESKLIKWANKPGANLSDLIGKRFDFNTIAQKGFNTHNTQKAIGPNFRGLNDYCSNYTRIYRDGKTGEEKEVESKTAYASAIESWNAFEYRNSQSFSHLIQFLDKVCDIFYAREFDILAYNLSPDDQRLSGYNQVLNHFSKLLGEFLYAKRGDLFDEEKSDNAMYLIRRLASQKYLVRYQLIAPADEANNKILKIRRENLEKKMIALIMRIRLEENSVICEGVDKYIDSLTSSEM